MHRTTVSWHCTFQSLSHTDSEAPTAGHSSVSDSVHKMVYVAEYNTCSFIIMIVDDKNRATKPI
jgi:hypothetical protein